MYSIDFVKMDALLSFVAGSRPSKSIKSLDVMGRSLHFLYATRKVGTAFLNCSILSLILERYFFSMILCETLPVLTLVILLGVTWKCLRTGEVFSLNDRSSPSSSPLSLLSLLFSSLLSRFKEASFEFFSSD